MIDKIKDYLASLEERERRLVITAAVLVILFLPYQILWKPVSNSVVDLENKVQQKQKDLSWMQGKVSEVRSLSKNNVNSGDARSLFGVIERSAQTQFGQNVSIKQSGKTGIKIKISNSSFDDIMNWLDNLVLKHKVIIKDMTIINENSPGRVTISVILET